MAIVGASGYAGAEAVRLLATHPCAKVARVTSERSAGKPLQGECPWLSTDLVLESYDAARIDEPVVLLCGESGFAMRQAPELLREGRVVIDFSADFRLRDLAVFEAHYGREHASPQLLEEAVYGMTELVDDEALRGARLVANPGCYPTAAALALVPLARTGLLAGVPVVDAKSGVSGAGRSKKETAYLMAELSGSFGAYGVVGHRHTPEIEQSVGRPIRFTPHLLPVARGLQATIHVPLTEGTGRQEVLDAWRDTYAGRPFIEVREDGWPSTKEVVGSNRCVLAAAFDDRTGHAVLVSVIDNLVKGAAGQAVQNMNVCLGLPEEAGLPANGVWP